MPLRKETRAFIDAGWVDPQRLKFTGPHLRRVRADVPRLKPLVDGAATGPARLFQGHAVQAAPVTTRDLLNVLDRAFESGKFGTIPV